MRFFDDMNSKYGFQDGIAIPEGAELYREVYIRCLNALLEKHGSDIRVVAYNRPGVHNPCLIVRTTVRRYRSLSPEEIVSGSFAPSGTEPLRDSGYALAEDEAQDAGIDEFVVIEARLDNQALDQFLKGVSA